MRLDKPRLRVRLMPSGFGFAALALAMLLVTLGIRRGELSATIAGSALIVYFAFSLISLFLSALLYAGHTFRVSWTEDHFFSVSIVSSIISDTKQDATLIASLRHALTTAEIAIEYSTDPLSTVGKKLSVSIPVRASAELHDPGPLPRGSFIPTAARVCLVDFAAFLSLSWRIDSAISLDRLIVRPIPQLCRFPVLPAGKTGTTTGKSARSRSEELHETRQYLPGDDPRRVNWKVYAHSGELSVREGELLPPPSSEYVFLFSEAFPPGAGTTERRLLQAAFDELMSKAAYLALELLKNHHVITIIVFSENGTPTQKSFMRDEINAERLLLEALSLPRLREAPANLAEVVSVSAPRAEILFFSLPTGFSSDISQYGECVRAFIGPLSVAPDTVSFKSLARGFLYRNTENKTSNVAKTFDGKTIERACVSLFKEGIHAEAL